MKRLAVLVTLAMISAVPTIAHHGWAGYAEEEFEISGTLETQVALAGPHGTMKIKVDNQIWDITLSPPVRVQGAGRPANRFLWAQSNGARSSSSDRSGRGEDTARHLQRKTFNCYPDRK